MSSINPHNLEARLEKVASEVHDDGHRATVMEYLHERRANGVAPSTLYANASVLRDYANFLGKPFQDAARADLNAYANKRTSTRRYRSTNVEGETTETVRPCFISDATMDHRKVVIRCFYKWLNGGKLPECVEHLKTRTARRDQDITDRLISRDELGRLLQAAGEPRLRALVAVMWESGLRAGEVVALNVGSVEFDPLGAKLVIPKNAHGLKTGSRTVRVLPTESCPYLQAWWEQHPLKDDPSAPLFYGSSRRNPHGRMLPSSLYAVIQRLAKQAGIKKHIKPHDFRHTAATEKARLGYNEAQLRWYFGWSRTSDMPSHYVHLAGADFDRMMMEKHGIQVPEDKPRAVLWAACPVCGHSNDTTTTYCGKCRHRLKPGADAQESGNEVLMHTVRDMVAEVLQSMTG